MELLPAIDILDGRAVRLAKGDYNKVTVYNEDPVDQAKRFEDAGATWLHVVDLNGAKSGSPDNIAIIESIMAKTLLKVEVGGGIRSMDVLQRYYDAGVTRTVLGTALITDKQFASDALSKFKGMITAGIDAKDGNVAVQGWRDESGVPAVELAAEMAALGCTHVVYTDIARDGMQTGIEVAAYERMADAFGGPVIASGGVSTLDDLKNLAAVAHRIEGVITGRAVYEHTLDVTEAVEYCQSATIRAMADAVSKEGCAGC